MPDELPPPDEPVPQVQPAPPVEPAPPYVPAPRAPTAPRPADLGQPPVQAPAPPPGSRTPVGCLVAAGVIAVALVIAALIIAAAVRDTASGVSRTVQGMQPGNVVATLIGPQTPTIVVRPPAIRQVRAVADLTTVSTLMSTVVDVQQARVGNIIYEKLILIACGRVKAGVDLGKLTDKDVQVSPDGLTVTVRLPKAELQDVYLIDDPTQACTTRVYDRTNLLLIPQTKDLETEARDKAVQALRDMAIQSGILDEADSNARVAIERVLLLAGYQKVVFVEANPPAATPIVVTPTPTGQ